MSWWSDENDSNHAWDVVSLVELHPATIRWDKQIPNMKEIVRPHHAWQPLTDLLDPDAKPYLIVTDKGEYHILYWKAWFEGDKWTGSDWYDEPPDARNTRRSRHWPKRIWELTGVEYAPRKITNAVSPLHRLLADNKVKKFKSLANGLIAIRKAGMWHYYRFEMSIKRYVKIGSTMRLER